MLGPNTDPNGAVGWLVVTAVSIVMASSLRYGRPCRTVGSVWSCAGGDEHRHREIARCHLEPGSFAARCPSRLVDPDTIEYIIDEGEVTATDEPSDEGSPGCN